MSDFYELTHPDTPPSVNAVGVGAGGGQHGHWRYTKVKREWEGILFAHLLAAKVPKGLARVRATAVLRFPDRRRRDEGNFRALLEKCLGDVLVAQRWLPDDTPDYYTFGGLEFDEERGTRRTVVRLEVT